MYLLSDEPGQRAKHGSPNTTRCDLGLSDEWQNNSQTTPMARDGLGHWMYLGILHHGIKNVYGSMGLELSCH